MEGAEKMTGHLVLFIAVLVAAATAALSFPSRTASEGCPARVVLAHSAVQASVGSKENC
jgi:hypothetical protein